jgi:hypothetical protein
MKNEDMNVLSCLPEALVLALHGFLAPVCKKRHLTVCKTIPASLTLKFKYLNLVFVEMPESH